MIEKMNIEWSKPYDTKDIKVGDAVLFRRGTHPKNPVDLCFAIEIGNHIEIVASKAGWARNVGLFTKLGVLLDNDAVMGSIVRVGKVSLPLWANVKLGDN